MYITLHVVTSGALSKKCTACLGVHFLLRPPIYTTRLVLYPGVKTNANHCYLVFYLLLWHVVLYCFAGGVSRIMSVLNDSDVELAQPLLRSLGSMCEKHKARVRSSAKDKHHYFLVTIVGVRACVCVCACMLY